MENKPFKKYKTIGNIMSGLSFLILLIGGYWLWKKYSEIGKISWEGVLFIAIFFIINIMYWNVYRVSNVHCPICKSKLFPLYESMENGKEEWIQIKFPCEKCNVVWDTEERDNVQDKEHLH